MAEINTIARPYAEALFRLAQPAERKHWQEVLEGLAEIAVNPAMQEVVGDPRLSAEQLYSVVSSVLNQPLGAEQKNFVETLIDNNRLIALPEIATQFKALSNAAEGSSDALIYSAFPIDAAQLKTLVASLEKRFARHLSAEVVIDESLIGGVRVVVGDQVLDSSVRSRLDDMRVALSA